MSREDAEECLANYRAVLKAWTEAVTGVGDGDCDALYWLLDVGQNDLAQMALLYPDMSYAIDLLIAARNSQWARFAAERLHVRVDRRS